MTFYFLILFGFYFVLLVILRIGWTKAVALKETQSREKPLFISVVVAMRNEECNIESLLHDLFHQNYLPSDFEIIIVDDHSTDESVHRAQAINTLQNLSIIFLNEESKGKKAALTHGINLAKGDIIVTTDADCSLHPNWLANINSKFQDNKINMAAGMVTIANEENFFSRWQQMEFASVMGTGISAFGWSKPLMCNGANLAFRKRIFEEVKGYEGNEHIASGDDEFLMRKIMTQYPGSVYLLSSPETIVITKP
jgi:biofilm PGA synthesis N-glycosyltransferase PgaC